MHITTRLHAISRSFLSPLCLSNPVSTRKAKSAGVSISNASRYVILPPCILILNLGCQLWRAKQSHHRRELAEAKYMSQEVNAESALHICSEGLLVGGWSHALLILDPIRCILHDSLQCKCSWVQWGCPWDMQLPFFNPQGLHPLCQCTQGVFHLHVYCEMHHKVWSLYLLQIELSLSFDGREAMWIANAGSKPTRFGHLYSVAVLKMSDSIVLWSTQLSFTAIWKSLIFAYLNMSKLQWWAGPIFLVVGVLLGSWLVHLDHTLSAVATMPSASPSHSRRFGLPLLYQDLCRWWECHLYREPLQPAQSW